MMQMPIAQVARELGINAGTLGNWVAKDLAGRGDRPQLSRTSGQGKLTSSGRSS